MANHIHRTKIALAPLSVLLSAVSAMTFCEPASGSEGSRIRFLSSTAEVAAVQNGSSKTGLTSAQLKQSSLADLRDVGLCVLQIKQQAKNIFLEATRKAVDFSSTAELEDPYDISPGQLKSDEKYLETRPEWLTFYVGTMEPIIHLFKEDVKDVQTGMEHILVPKGTRAEFEKLYADYESAVAQLNEHLSIIYDDIHQPKNNLVIAKEAMKMYELAERLEKQRMAAFKLFKEAGTTETEEIRPTHHSN